MAQERSNILKERITARARMESELGWQKRSETLEQILVDVQWGVPLV